MGTTPDLATKFAEIQALVFEGRAMEAFEKYYAEDVVMQENNHPPTVGKEANREREADFFSKVVEFHGGEVKAVAFGEDVIFSEWSNDYTHKEWGRCTYTQVSVQRWRDGQVVHEKFYYTM